MAKEAPIQKAILEYLAHKKYFHWRNNTGAMKTQHGSFVRFGTPGSPDIFFLRNGFLWGIEVKAPGKYLRPEQKAFKEAMIEHGGTYILARSLDDVIAAGI